MFAFRIHKTDTFCLSDWISFELPLRFQPKFAQWSFSIKTLFSSKKKDFLSTGFYLQYLYIANCLVSLECVDRFSSGLHHSKAQEMYDLFVDSKRKIWRLFFINSYEKGYSISFSNTRISFPFFGTNQSKYGISFPFFPSIENSLRASGMTCSIPHMIEWHSVMLFCTIQKIRNMIRKWYSPF